MTINIPFTHRDALAVKRFMFAGTEEANVFIALCRRTKVGMIVDAGGFDRRMIDFIAANDIDIRAIFITHNHYDHTQQLPAMLERFRHVTVHASSTAVYSSCRIVRDGDPFRLGEIAGAAYHVPGHTPDMMVLVLADHIFSGDAVFAGSVGGTSAAENFRQQVTGIREKILAYPDSTRIHPGHGPDTSVGIERVFNPFLNAET